MPSNRVVVIPNGLELTQFQARTSHVPSRRVIMVANLRPEKGHDTLIDAAAIVLNRFPDARFDIVGDGTERDRLIAYAHAKGVAAAVSFLGHCEDVPARLSAADVFVLPSESEAFPNAVLEAMAAGLPVVASAVGGILEVVRNGETGLLVPPRRPDALADAIGRLLSDATLQERLGSTGRGLVESRYSFSKMVAAFDALYLTELARRGVPSVRAEWAAL